MEQKEINQLLKRCHNPKRPHLNLSNLKQQQCKCVLKYRNWDFIKYLHMELCSISDLDIDNIVQLKWPQLIQLHLEQNKITEKGLSKLLQLDLVKLQLLYMINNRIGDTGFKLIIRRIGQSLKFLLFQNCSISKLGVQSMLGVKLNILNLSLQRNSIGSQGIKFLVKANMPQLKILGIGKCEIGDEGLIHLSKGLWTKLQNLHMMCNDMNLNGYTMFNNEDWKFLSKLETYQTNTIFSMQLVTIVSTGNVDIVNWIQNNQLKQEIAKIMDQKFKTI